MLFYQIHPGETRCKIEKASPKRVWMDATQSHFAYRCLPLTIANMLGYHIFIKSEVAAEWDGRSETDAIKIISDNTNSASSIFGHGILTFHIDWLVTTDDDQNTIITGPHNHFIKNAHALTGVYETDWAPFSFTMNWKISNPGRVKFGTDDPICHIYTIPRGHVESEPIYIRPLSENQELYKQYSDFDKSRAEFIKRDENQKGWQKHYFKGNYANGQKCPITNHQTKINMPEIKYEHIGDEKKNTTTQITTIRMHKTDT